MVSQDSHGPGHFFIGIILNAACLFNIAYSGSMKVDLIYIVKTVKECKISLEAPAGINIFLSKRSKCSVLMLFILHENIVTDLGILTAMASGLTVGTAGRYIVLYIEHLAVGTAGSEFKTPPVILCGKVEDILSLKA